MLPCQNRLPAEIRSLAATATLPTQLQPLPVILFRKGDVTGPRVAIVSENQLSP